MIVFQPKAVGHRLPPAPFGSVWVVSLADGRWGWSASGEVGGNPPRRSDAEAGHARQQQPEQRLIRRRPRQMQANLRLQRLDAHGQLDQTQPQRAVTGATRQRDRRGVSVRRLHISQ